MSTRKHIQRDLIGYVPRPAPDAWVWVASAVRATVESQLAAVGALLIAFLAIAFVNAAVLWAVPLLFALVFAAKLLDRPARRAALRRARVMPGRLPEPKRFADDEARAIVVRLGEVREAIWNVLDTGPHGPGFDLMTAVAQVSHLERDVIVLTHRAECLATLIADHPLPALAARARRHQERLEREDDPVRASLLRRSGARLRERLDAATALAGERHRLLEASADALGALEALPAQMVVVQLRRLLACHAPAALREEDDLRANLHEIERALARER